MLSGIKLEEFYAQSLGITSPWEVTEVKIIEAEKRFQISVECSEKATWADPETGEQTQIHGWRERSWRHLDTCEFETWVTVNVPRVKLSSGKTKTVVVPWAEESGRFTKSMESHVIDILLRTHTVGGAARIARITRDQAEGVMNRAVKRGLARREEISLSQVGIDEKAIRKRHQYATILTDLDSGRVVEVVEKRTKQAAKELLENLPDKVSQSIEAVAMDMWPAYIGAVEDVLPEAAIVFDRFHIKKHLNEAVDRVRRKENRKLVKEGDASLKGSKYSWLKKRPDLRTKAAAEFRKLLAEQFDTGKAWTLKELFDRFWQYSSRSWAMRFLDNWIEEAKDTMLKPLIEAADMLRKHEAGLMNYFSFQITNAAAEGINSMIQTLRSAARGLPDFEKFRNRVLFHLGQLNLRPI